MAYTKNKVYTGIDKNGKEYQYEATTHLGVDIDDILYLREELFDEIGGNFTKLYDFIQMSFGRYGINISGKDTYHYIKGNLSNTEEKSFLNDCKDFISEGNLYVVYKTRDLLTYMKTYYNIARKVGKQIDTYINEFLPRRLQPYSDILSIAIDDRSIERYYYYESKDKLDCTTKLRENLASGIENTQYYGGDSNKLVKKGELESALRENGLSYDDILMDLIEDGFVRSYLKEMKTFHIFSDEYKVQKINFGLDLNHTTSISFIGTHQGTTFEEDIMNRYQTNNYFLALCLFYKDYLEPAIEVYKYIEQKLNSNKDVIFEEAEREGNYCISGEYQAQTKEAQDIEIETYSRKYKKILSIVEYLAVKRRLCKLDTLKFIFDPPYGDVIKKMEMKYSEVFVK